MLMRYAYGAAHKTLFLLREKDFFDNFFYLAIGLRV